MAIHETSIDRHLRDFRRELEGTLRTRVKAEEEAQQHAEQAAEHSAKAEEARRLVLAADARAATLRRVLHALREVPLAPFPPRRGSHAQTAAARPRRGRTPAYPLDRAEAWAKRHGGAFRRSDLAQEVGSREIARRLLGLMLERGTVRRLDPSLHTNSPKTRYVWNDDT